MAVRFYLTGKRQRLDILNYWGYLEYFVLFHSIFWMVAFWGWDNRYRFFDNLLCLPGGLVSLCIEASVFFMDSQDLEIDRVLHSDFIFSVFKCKVFKRRNKAGSGIHSNNSSSNLLLCPPQKSHCIQISNASHPYKKCFLKQGRGWKKMQPLW